MGGVSAHTEAVTTLKQVTRAYEAIRQAEQRYRETLREALAAGVKQAEIAKELGVTREKLRQDAMPEEKIAELRNADAKRKAELRARARKAE